MNEQARWANKTDQTERAPRDKITTFDTNKSTKNDKMILDLCTYKGLGVGYDDSTNQTILYATCSSSKEDFFITTLKIRYAEKFV